MVLDPLLGVALLELGEVALPQVDRAAGVAAADAALDLVVAELELLGELGGDGLVEERGRRVGGLEGVGEVFIVVLPGEGEGLRVGARTQKSFSLPAPGRTIFFPWSQVRARRTRARSDVNGLARL